MTTIHPSYPTAEEIDLWCSRLYEEAENCKYSIKITDKNGYTPDLGHFNSMNHNYYVEFTIANGASFYAYWQPAFTNKAPLAVHTPGYGAEIHEHPELVAQGFNVLHVEPMGYCTPEGRQEDLKNEHDTWPVLPDTVTTRANGGYYIWLQQVVIATNWAIKHFELDRRVSFFGTSQGGGGSLLLASLFKDKGVQTVCADVPFLTNFPLANFRGAYDKVLQAIEGDIPNADEWKAIGYVDTLSHAHRLQLPVLLTGGEVDIITPIDTIESLFAVLPHTKSYTMLKGIGHSYTREFIPLTSTWLRLYG